MEVRDFKSVRKNTLLGFFTVELDSGMVIKECSVHESYGKRWFAFPGRPMLDVSGAAMKDERGKVRYQNVIEIPNRARHNLLQALVLERLAPHLTETA